MTLINFLLLILGGFIAGCINVLAGGGSLLTLPLLIFMGLPTSVANATNRVAIFSQNIFAVAGFKSKGVSAYPYSLYLGLSAALGATIGATISVDLEDALFNRIIAVVMVMVIVLTVVKPKTKSSGENEKMSKKAQLIGIISFFFVGIYGGFIQAGIGFVIIAVLTNVNGFSLVKTNSAKVFIALVYTAAALVVFIYNGVVNWQYGLVLAAGNSLGGWVTSRWSVKKGDKWIRWFLIVTVTAMAIKLWFYS